MLAKIEDTNRINFVTLVSESHGKGGGHAQRQIGVAEEIAVRGHNLTVIGQLSPNTSAAFSRLGTTIVGARSEAESHRLTSKILSSLGQRAEKTALIVDDYDLLQSVADFLGLSNMVVVFTDGQEINVIPQLIVDSARPADWSLKGGRISGPEAAMIKNEFRRVRNTRMSPSKRSSSFESIAISFGGADSADLSFLLSSCLSQMQLGKKIEIVLGDLYHGALGQRGLKLPNRSLISLTNSSRYLSVLSRSKGAIGAAGLSAFERAFIGLPSLNFAIARNQIGIANHLLRVGAANVGTLPLQEGQIIKFIQSIEDPDIYNSMVAACLDSVDGAGARRLIERIEGEI